MSLRLTLAAFAVLATSGCSLADPAGSKTGELGNGGFLFSCDDAVACTPYADDATKFPEAVSLGSTFSVKFTPKTAVSLDIHFNESAPNRGITVAPIIPDYVSSGPSGFVGVKSGYAAIAARDAAGQLVDYTVLRVAKPDALIIYRADESTATPSPVDTGVTLELGESSSFKAFAQQNKGTLAGKLSVEWTSSDDSIVGIQSTTGGRVTIVAKKSGSATLSATGGTFTQRVPVTVP